MSDESVYGDVVCICAYIHVAVLYKDIPQVSLECYQGSRWPLPTNVLGATAFGKYH